MALPLAGAIAILFLPRQSPRVLKATTFFIMIGTLFATFPLMPPRLLDTIGGPGSWSYVDTLVKFAPPPLPCAFASISPSIRTRPDPSP